MFKSPKRALRRDLTDVCGRSNSCLCHNFSAWFSSLYPQDLAEWMAHSWHCIQYASKKKKNGLWLLQSFIQGTCISFKSWVNRNSSLLLLYTLLSAQFTNTLAWAKISEELPLPLHPVICVVEVVCGGLGALREVKWKLIIPSLPRGWDLGYGSGVKRRIQKVE